MPIRLHGSIQATICLESLKEIKASINLRVLKDDLLSADIIIGRDFLEDNNITVLYKPVPFQTLNRLQLFAEVAWTDLTDTASNSIEGQLNDIQTDFDKKKTTQRLVDTIREIEYSDVPEIKDDYRVKITLKDTSTYAYAPRKFAWKERLQIREITDDLLARGIIKYSNSLYCARVIPVKKKNGTMRLCVDPSSPQSKSGKAKTPFPTHRG
ncbi:hypothetical protein X777_01993 [Ooceraea biroi]|uniref:Uncharacterized protein n=1 Tax=Ooceraea biroi TaxID=2015173 RepID=A0A026WPN1_OOCBI|nr:hypothetical protein X777_01993 [Ooceraea biroi]